MSAPDLDNTRSVPERPDLIRLREGIGSHQAAAYIVHLEAAIVDLVGHEGLGAIIGGPT